MISYPFLNLDFSKFQSLWTPRFQLCLKEILVGNILPTYFFLFNPSLKTTKLWDGISLKQPLVIIGCGHYYKIALLVMEKGVWLIPVVWSVWLVWIVEIVVLWILLCWLVFWCCCYCCDFAVCVIFLWGWFLSGVVTTLGHLGHQTWRVTWRGINPLQLGTPS